MAIVAHFVTENMDRASYDAINEQLTAAGTPPLGMHHHFCYGAPDRLEIFQVWESRDALETFGETLTPAINASGVVVAEPTVWALEDQCGGIAPVQRLKVAHDAFTAGDLDTAMSLVAPSLRFIDHGRGVCCGTRAEFRSWLDEFKTGSSDMAIVDATYLSCGDWVTARFRVVGVQDGPLAGFPASNRPYSLEICEVWRFNAVGDAVEGYNYADNLSLFAQLGHIALPGSPAN